MNVKKRIVFHSAISILSITILTLQLFVFEAPDGTLGFLLCLGCVWAFLFGIINLYRTSDRFKRIITALIDALFWAV